MNKNFRRYFIFILTISLTTSSLFGQIVNSFPYSENFDSGSPFWVANNSGPINTQWELGSPNFGLTSSTHSGLFCWDTNLDTSYQINAKCNLETPEFNFTNTAFAVLSFWQNRNSEIGWDGLHIDYSLNQGFTWNNLGQYADPLGTNWYNTPNLNSISNAGWSGTNNGWQKSSYLLSAFNNIPSVKFRFVFTSDAFVIADGISIDDFTITPALTIDAALDSIITPLKFLSSGSAVPTIKVLIKNFGVTTLNNYSIAYRLNGGTPITKNFITPILPFTSDTLNIPGFIVPAGVFNICISINAPGDLNHNNDSICSIGTGLASITIPYTDNFDGANNGWISNNPTDTLSKWQLGLPTFGYTNSTHSGINCWDINLNSPYSTNANAELRSPIFDFSGVNNATLSFWKNFKTEINFDGSRLDYSVDGGITYNTLGIFNDTLGTNWYNELSINSSSKSAWAGISNSWEKSTYRLSILNNEPNVIFKFIFTSDASVISDGFSIDDFQISQGLALDATVDSITTNLFNLSAGNLLSNVVIKIKNEGFQSISNFNVGYRVNNGSPVVINYAGTLPSFASAFVSLTGFIVPSGNYTVCAFTNLIGDLNPPNDSLCITQYGQTPIIPASFNNFESGSLGFTTMTTGSPNTNWELGNPTYGSTNSAHSGNNAWDTNLNSPYKANAKTYLYTPIYDLTAAVDPWLYFWQNRNCNYDGFYIEYYSYLTGMWKPIPNVINVPALNWYNSTIYVPTSQAGWNQSSLGWIKSGISLDSLSIPTLVQFRFIFSSSTLSTATGDGVSIDDVELKVDYQNDAEITSLISPGIEAAASLNNDVIITLRNNGIQTINNLVLKYSNNNGTIASKNWTGVLLHDSSIVVSLPQVVPSPGLNNIAVYVDWVNDLRHDNDTLKYSYNGISVISPPFSDNLESGNNYWVVNPSTFGNTTWELGSPNYGSTTSSHSGSNCWDINLTTSYGILANTKLYSPIFNYSNSLTSTLDFWLNYDSEFNQDGLRIEYSTNGNTWSVLGIQNDPNGTNWYNTTIAIQNKPGWSGASGGWIHSTYNTTAFNGLSFIRYRFVFTSDISLIASGFSIDDFNVDQTVGLKDLVDGIKFNISPNPATDVLNLNFENLNNKVYIYKIYDISGRLIRIPENNSTITSSELIIPINDLSPGIYQLMLIVDGYKKMVSFVKS